MNVKRTFKFYCQFTVKCHGGRDIETNLRFMENTNISMVPSCDKE